MYHSTNEYREKEDIHSIYHYSKILKITRKKCKIKIDLNKKNAFNFLLIKQNGE